MMKWFKGWFKEKAPEINHKQQAIDDFKRFKDIGETFDYLGVTMMVTSHSQLIPGYYTFDIRPMLVCDYKNDLGEIRVIKFAPYELQNLIELNNSNIGE